MQSLLAFFEDSGLKEINVGNTPNQKNFTLDGITKGDDQVSYIAGGAQSSDIKDYTLEVDLSHLDKSTAPYKNTAHLIGGLSLEGNALNNTLIFTKIPSNPERKINLYGGISLSQNTNNNLVNVTGIKDGSDKGGIFNIFSGFSFEGEANENKVTIKESKIQDNVYGGVSDKKSANLNVVDINSAEVVGNVDGGRSFGGDMQYEASKNKVNIKDSEIGGLTTAGFAVMNSNSNKVVIESSKIGTKAVPMNIVDSVIGGRSYAGIANSNKVLIKGNSEIFQKVTGGQTDIGKEANSNEVIVESSNMRAADVYDTVIIGGHGGDNGNTEKNSVIVTSDSKLEGMVIGGFARNSVIFNKVTVDNSTVDGNIYGGYSNTFSNTYQGKANSNSVVIKNKTKANGAVHGGYANNDASLNNVLISDSSIMSVVYGGFSQLGNANENAINITSSSYVDNTIYGGVSMKNGNANNNTLNISSSHADWVIYGGYSEEGNANSNQVLADSSEMADDIYGGYAKHEANNNILDITSSNINGKIYSGKSEEGAANNNKVSLKISKVGSSVAGGSAKHEANNNILDITSSDIGGDVYGGYSNESTAINNTVNLFHNSARDLALGKHFLVKGVIHGGLSDGSKDAILGNKLNVTGKNLIAGNIENFDEVNFNLPQDIKTNDVVLQLTKNEPTTLNSVKVNPYVEQGESKAIVKNLKPKEKIYIIKKASIDENTLEEEQAIDKKLEIKSKELTKATKSIVSEVGASTIYKVNLNKDKSNLYLEVGEIESTTPTPEPTPTPTPKPSKPITPKVNPKINHTLIPNLASSHVVNQMSDLMSDNISNIAMLDDNISVNTDNIISFGYVKGYKSNIDKSDTDINGVVVDVGVASRADNALMGGFFEYSYADYDGSANSYSSDGKINAYAVGALARFDLRNNFFIDSYAKIGKLNNKYTLKGYDNLKVDKDSTFYSLGAFLGHDSYFDRFMLTNRLGYAYSNVDGYDLDINGETLNIKDISSKRIKFDSIAYYNTNTDTNLYARARLIYELDGKSSTYAPNINKTIESTNKGFSGGGELGVIYSIKPLSNISFGVGAMGGKIDELSANLRFVYGW